MRTLGALLVGGLLLLFAPTPGSVAAASPAVVVITDSIGVGAATRAADLGTASVVVPAGASVTYVAAMDARLAGQSVAIWTRTRTGSWEATTTRTVAADGTVRYAARVLSWIGIQARFAGSADFAAAAAHGRFATTSPDGTIRLTIGCDAFTPASPDSAGPVALARTVVALVDGTLSVTFCSNASTGFQWDAPTYNHQHLRLISRSAAGSHVALPGAAGTETFRFAIESSGTTPVRFTYSQPWAGGTKAAWAVALTVRTYSAPGSPVAVTCDEFAAAADASGHSLVARPVAARVDGTIVVTLCSNASTGFAWEAPAFDHAALRLVRVVSTAPPAGLIGAAGTRTWTFRALAPGSHEIRFAYSRPATGGEKGTWKVAIIALVRR